MIIIITIFSSLLLLSENYGALQDLVTGVFELNSRLWEKPRLGYSELYHHFWSGTIWNASSGQLVFSQEAMIKGPLKSCAEVGFRPHWSGLVVPVLYCKGSTADLVTCFETWGKFLSYLATVSGRGGYSKSPGTTESTWWHFRISPFIFCIFLMKQILTMLLRLDSNLVLSVGPSWACPAHVSHRTELRSQKARRGDEMVLVGTPAPSWLGHLDLFCSWWPQPVGQGIWTVWDGSIWMS